MLDRAVARVTPFASATRAVVAIALLGLSLAACTPGPTLTPSPTPHPSPSPCPSPVAPPSSSPARSAPTLATATIGAASPGAPTGATPIEESACPAIVANSSTSPSPSLSPSPTARIPTPTPGPTFITHTVQRGDNLTSLARRYSTTPRSVAYWNRETYPSLDPDSPAYAPNKIEIGWKLRLVPGVTLPDQGPLPTRRASPLPQGSRPPPPTPPADGSSLVVASGSRTLLEVALTFDLGGDIDPDLDILQWLIDNDVRATIFVNGQTASATDTGRQAMALIAAHPDLFTIGNQGFDGQSFTALDADGMRDQLQRTEDAVFAATGRSTKPLFRPPFGAHDAAVRSTVAAAGWAYTVMWDVDSVDAKPTTQGGPTADDIVAKVLSRAKGGSIVLLHLGGSHTLQALPGIVEGLRARGLEPVTVAELLGL